MLEEEVEAFGRPVLLVHGDYHDYVVDQPLRRRTTGALLENSTLQHLELGRNGIGFAGAEAIVHALSKNSTLLKLDLSSEMNIALQFMNKAPVPQQAVFDARAEIDAIHVSRCACSTHIGAQKHETIRACEQTSKRV